MWWNIGAIFVKSFRNCKVCHEVIHTYLHNLRRSIKLWMSGKKITMPKKTKLIYFNYSFSFAAAVTYKTIILPVFVWLSLWMMKVNRRCLRTWCWGEAKLFGTNSKTDNVTGGWRKFHNEGFITCSAQRNNSEAFTRIWHFTFANCVSDVRVVRDLWPLTPRYSTYARWKKIPKRDFSLRWK
jgi:hypothetical protein